MELSEIKDRTEKLVRLVSKVVKQVVNELIKKAIVHTAKAKGEDCERESNGICQKQCS